MIRARAHGQKVRWICTTRRYEKNTVLRSVKNEGGFKSLEAALTDNYMDEVCTWTETDPFLRTVDRLHSRWTHDRL